MSDKIEFRVLGMSCTACASTVKKTLKEINGVKDVSVNFTDKKAVVYLDSKTIDKYLLKDKVLKAGYKLVDIDNAEEANKKFVSLERKRLFFSWMITLPLTIKMLGEMIFGYYLVNMQTAFYIDLILSFIVIFIIGFPVLKSTINAVKKFSFNMDSLIGIGTIAAYFTGILKILGLNIDNFAVVGAMIMSINFIGNYLKISATGKASSAIKQLVELSAKTAHLIKNDGSEINVDINELNIDDEVIIRPGEKIPVDGVIVDGVTAIDESIATGESVPVDKKTGDKVIGATINQMGVIRVKILKVGKDTFLSQIIKLVEEAQSSKVPIQEFADRVTSYFVPIILLISFITLLFWLIFPGVGSFILQFFSSYIPWITISSSIITKALFAAVATLVIACPCALGLATPTALMVGMGKGAVNGILIRNGEAIQTSKKITTIVFDKTGTITLGKPVVTSYKTSINKKDFFKLVGSVENLSEHPIAKAIVTNVKEMNISFDKVKNFQVIAGKGIEANIENKEIHIGSKKYFDELNINFNDYNVDIINYQNKGYTVILAAINKKTIGIIGISDKIKEDSIETINKLHKIGINSVLLTGDNTKAANFIANEVGIDKVYAELLPQDKINIIKELQKKGEVVAMVGDGINDAPSLKQADVGIAIGTGTDIAIESADITLVSGSLTGVYRSIILSQKTFKKIMQNLFWAFFYNIVAVPLAVLGLLHPAVAEISMALSSINVVGNSLRLKRISLD